MSEQTGSSSIYDLGYRSYDGPRIGRRGTLLTLYVHGLRSAFGLGRRTTSKIAPIGLAILAFLPAIVQLGVGAITSVAHADIEVFAHEDYFEYVRVILVLFCATVAPELVGRDQRSRTLSLYFSRAVTRLDYAIAKLAALTTAMLVLTLGPQALLFVGNGMTDDDLTGYLAHEWDLVFPILGSSVLISLVIAAIGLAIAAWVPRRAYATAAIVGAFVLTLAASSIVMETVEANVGRWALLASPYAWEGAIRWLFRVDPPVDSALADAALDGWVYLTAVVALTVVTAALTLWRLRRVSV